MRKTNKKPDTLIESARVAFPDLWHAPKESHIQDFHGQQLIEFAQLDTTYNLDKYPLSKGYNPYRFWKIAETNQFFKDCLESAQLIVADRMKEDWRKRDQKDYAKEMLPVYDQNYANAKKPKEQTEQTKVQYVVIPSDKS